MLSLLTILPLSSPSTKTKLMPNRTPQTQTHKNKARHEFPERKYLFVQEGQNRRTFVFDGGLGEHRGYLEHLRTCTHRSCLRLLVYAYVCMCIHEMRRNAELMDGIEAGPLSAGTKAWCPDSEIVSRIRSRIMTGIESHMERARSHWVCYLGLPPALRMTPG